MKRILNILFCFSYNISSSIREQYVNETVLRNGYFSEHFNSIDELKRLPMEVVQYHGNLRAQVSKLSLGPSLSKISLIFWTCCAGRIRY